MSLVVVVILMCVSRLVTLSFSCLQWRWKRCTGPGSLFNVIQGILIVPPIIFGLALISFGFLSRQLYFQFGWDVFRLVGASPELKSWPDHPFLLQRGSAECIVGIHRAYQTLLSLLKLLLFFAMAFCLAVGCLDCLYEPMLTGRQVPHPCDSLEH